MSGYLLANAANSIIARNLADRFSTKDALTDQIQSDVDKAVRDFEKANERNIFNAKREKIGVIERDIPQGPKRPSGNWENAVPSSLGFRLLGTAVFQNPASSLATIATSKSSRDRGKLFSTSDCENSIIESVDAAFLLPQICSNINGQAKVARIESEKVYIFNEAEGRYEYLALEGSAKDRSLPRKFGQAPEASAIGNGIRRVSENSYEIDQEELDMALANLSKIATQARAVPAFEDGKPVGFRLFSIKPNSVFSKIGLQNGDVINSINGYDLSSPDKALELYNKLKTEKNFTMDFKRNGSSKTSEYNVR